MISLSSRLLLGCFLLVRWSDANDEQQYRPRRRLAPHESIHRYLREENEAGNTRPKVTLVAGTRRFRGNSEDATEYELELIQVPSAVSPKTTYSIHGGPNLPIGDLGIKFLVPDKPVFGNDDDSNSSVQNATTFALISVDDKSEEVNGIAKRTGEKAMSIQQANGESVVAMEAPDFQIPKDWRCGVTSSLGSEFSGSERNLIADGGDSGESQHQQHPHLHHFHNAQHDHFEDEVDNLIQEISSNQSMHRRRTTGFSTPSFQVDIYIEIDQKLVDLNGNDLNTAFKYVNTLVTAASTIYSREVDTRLHVAHIALTSMYDDETDSLDALEKMKTEYGHPSTFHYKDGFGMDLHHALLGRDVGGGIAYPGTICNSRYGFGLSSNLKGSFEALDLATMWDLSVMMHEIGHSFGSYHTFQRQGYKPVVDRCFIRNTPKTCPDETALENSSTLMGYCDLCPDATTSSIAYTFGGSFVGGDPSDIANWKNNPLLASFNNEPKRVPKVRVGRVVWCVCALNR